MQFSTNIPSSVKEFDTLKPLKPNVGIELAATKVQNNWNVGVCYRCQGPISNAPFVERGHQVVSRLDANYKVKEKYSLGNLYCSRECRDGLVDKTRRRGRPVGAKDRSTVTRATKKHDSNADRQRAYREKQQSLSVTE